MGRWFGPDIVALSIPIAFASAGFAFMIGRAFVYDPEWSNGTAWYESPEAEKVGNNYRMQYQQFFHHRRDIPGAMSLFPNKVETK